MITMTGREAFALSQHFDHVRFHGIVVQHTDSHLPEPDQPAAIRVVDPASKDVYGWCDQVAMLTSPVEVLQFLADAYGPPAYPKEPSNLESRSP